MKNTFTLFLLFLSFSISAQLSISVSGTDIDCFNTCTGTLNAQASGGTAPYSYMWNDGRSDAQRSGLCAGTYSVTVTDSLGTTASGSIQLNEPAAALNVAISSTATLPQNPCTGTAWVTVSGGTLPYTYAWDGFAGYSTTDSAYNLCQREHCITVTDNNACTVVSCVTVSLDNSTALNQTAEDAFNIWPNPTADFLYFDCEDCSSVLIYDLKGNLLYQQTANNRTIDLQGFSAGIYIFSAENKIKRQIKTFEIKR